VVNVPEVVRNRVLAVGAERWLDELPALVCSIECERVVNLGGPTPFWGTESFVAEAALDDGSPAVLKLLIPGLKDAARHEITALRLAQGRGCALLLRDDAARGALLLERLGGSLHDLGLPIGQRLAVLASTAAKVWRPAPECGLPTGGEKGGACQPL
jgi:streptomycin 6-kinase